MFCEKSIFLPSKNVKIGLLFLLVCFTWLFTNFCFVVAVILVAGVCYKLCFAVISGINFF